MRPMPVVAPSVRDRGHGAQTRGTLPTIAGQPPVPEGIPTPQGMLRALVRAGCKTARLAYHRSIRAAAAAAHAAGQGAPRSRSRWAGFPASKATALSKACFLLSRTCRMAVFIVLRTFYGGAPLEPWSFCLPGGSGACACG